MKNLIQIALLELKIIFKDKHALGVLFVMPVALILFLSLALTDVYKQKVGTKIDIHIISSNSQFKDKIIEQFQKIGSAPKLAGEKVNFKSYIENNSPQVAIKFPNNLADILKGKESSEKIEIYFSHKLDKVYKDFVKNQILISLQGITISQVNRRLERLHQNGEIEKKISLKELTSSNEIIQEISLTQKIPNPIQQTIPAWTLFAMFFIVIPFSNGMIRDRENGTIKRLVCFNVSKSSFLLGKLSAYLFVNLIQFSLMFIIGKTSLPLITGENFELSNISFALIVTTILSSLVATGYALLISTFSKTNEQASAFGSISIVILALLGGVMIPHFVMPDFMQKLSYISPLYWSLSTYLEIFINEAKIIQVIPNLIVLISFWALTFTLSFIRFRWSNR